MGGGGRGRTRKRRRVIGGTSGSPFSGNNQKGERKKERLSAKTFIRTMATGKGRIKQTLEFLLSGIPAALKRVIIILEAAEDQGEEGLIFQC